MDEIRRIAAQKYRLYTGFNLFDLFINLFAVLLRYDDNISERLYGESHP